MQIFFHWSHLTEIIIIAHSHSCMILLITFLLWQNLWYFPDLSTKVIRGGASNWVAV